MSKVIKINLTPMEPFFFGSDRTFHYGEDDKLRTGSDYYIRSESFPLQTSVFGVLRYLGISDKSTGFVRSEINSKVVGDSSFEYENSQEFGMIEHISPLFLEDCEKGIHYIRVPRDHVNVHDSYVPFQEYSSVSTNHGKKMLPLDYDAKGGISEDFVSVSCLHRILRMGSVFHGVEKVGIDVQKKKYFKMEYIRMEPGYSFTFYATLKDEFPDIKEKMVFMGAKKSLFSVGVENNAQEPSICLPGHSPDDPGIKKVYFISDSWFDRDNTKLLIDNCIHTNFAYRTARGYKTNYSQDTCDAKGTSQKNRFSKTDRLFRLIRAGSVALVQEDKLKTISSLIDKSVNRHMQIIGCNNWIIGGMK